MTPATNTFTDLVKKHLKRVPAGKVVTYGTLAAYAGSPRAARQVVWILNTYAEKENLPWHRVINAHGKISLGRGHGYELQRELLRSEGVVFSSNDAIDLKKYLWSPG
jgi:methylated-DNA-protein-cysteine methyltransferase-like protein